MGLLLLLMTALTCLSYCQEDIRDIQREVEVLRLVGKHDNVAELISVFEDASYVHLILELCKGGELFDRVVAKGTFSEKMAAGGLQSMPRHGFTGKTNLICLALGLGINDFSSSYVIYHQQSLQLYCFCADGKCSHRAQRFGCAVPRALNLHTGFSC